MASLDDLLTTSKNIVTAINGLNTTIMRLLGSATSATVDVDTLVITGSGRVVSAFVVVAGSGDGGIYNSSSIAAAATGNQLCVVPQTAGAIPLGQVFNAGIVIKPGTGQSINVTYYLG